MIEVLYRWMSAIKMSNYRRIERRRKPQREAYQAWVALNDTLSDADRAALLDQQARLSIRPLISIIMPVYNAPVEWLDSAVQSVKNQIYPEWELCIADDNSSDQNTRSYLERLSSSDRRIRVTFRQNNGHISAASNTAIESSTGTWLVLMDQDDLLAEQALLEVIKTLEQHPDAGIIYSDEDFIDEQGIRVLPLRKEGWNRKDILKFNCVNHLGAYKADLVREAGGFRTGYEGAQDHDLVLRCIERLNDSQIIHVPKILYHWRRHENSTALARSSKPYAAAAKEKSIADHLARVRSKI